MSSPRSGRERFADSFGLPVSQIKKTLDLYLHYLRSVFHTCYYCLATFSFPEELERKCPTHLRREAKADVVNSKANG